MARLFPQPHVFVPAFGLDARTVDVAVHAAPDSVQFWVAQNLRATTDRIRLYEWLRLGGRPRDYVDLPLVIRRDALLGLMIEIRSFVAPSPLSERTIRLLRDVTKPVAGAPSTAGPAGCADASVGPASNRTS